MAEKFQIFELDVRLRSGERDVELEDEFHNFFHKYNLHPLLTNEHRAGTISVAWTDARSVIKEGGSYNKTLKEFADILQMNWHNKSFEEALFKMIHDARTFKQLMKTIEKTIRYVYDLDENKQDNMWNIIFYTKEVY